VCLCIQLFVGQFCIRCYVHFQCKGTVGDEQGARAGLTSVLNHSVCVCAESEAAPVSVRTLCSLPPSRTLGTFPESSVAS